MSSPDIAISYAFLDVFPHLARKQPNVEGLFFGPITTYLTHHVYLMSLLGFCVYVGIRVFSATEVDRRHSLAANVVLVASMCLYALFIGYMLAEQPLYRPPETCLFIWASNGGSFPGAATRTDARKAPGL